MTTLTTPMSLIIFVCCLATVTARVIDSVTDSPPIPVSTTKTSAISQHPPSSQHSRLAEQPNLLKIVITKNVATSAPVLTKTSDLSDILIHHVATSAAPVLYKAVKLHKAATTQNVTTLAPVLAKISAPPHTTTTTSSFPDAPMAAPTKQHLNLTTTSMSEYDDWENPTWPCSDEDSTNTKLSLMPGSAAKSRNTKKLTELHIIGLFALNGSYHGGLAFQYAAELAEADINRRPDVLPGYKIVLEPIDTQCDIATGMDLLYKKLYNTSSVKIMVLGGTCSDTTEQTAQASRKRNMVQISYSALSPRLSMSKFPWFFRMISSEIELSNARLALLQQFNWTTITMLQGSQYFFSATVECMRNILLKNNITVNDTLPFVDDPEKAIDQLQKSDARIIYFAAYEAQARKAVCVAYKKKFFGERIVWIFPGFLDLKWYDYDDFNCTAKEKLEVIDGYFTVSNVNMAPEEGHPVGTSQTRFLQRFNCKALQHLHKNNSNFKHVVHTWKGKSAQEIMSSGEDLIVPGQSRSPLGYDAMWAIALALNATLTDYIMKNGSKPDVLSEFSYDNLEMGQKLFAHMKNTSFEGLSGHVSFTESGDRVPQIVISQFQVSGLHTDKPSVALKNIVHYTDPSNLTWNLSLVRWRGRKRPVSSRQTVHVLKPLSWQLYTVMCLLSCVGVLLSLAFLVFNIKNRNVRLIKMSSPKINNLILIGCILFYSTVTVEDIHGLGLDVLCHVRLYLMVLGFSLGYGALFAKTWRVYEIMTAGGRILNTRALRDSRLFMTVFMLVAVNLCVLVLWTALDAMTMDPVDLEDAKVERDDVVEIPQSLVCQSQYKVQFTLGLMALQALLILFGVFLALQTRKITIPELNDSRWVGLCIYNVVLLGCIGAVLALGTRQPPHVTYLLQSIIVIVGTTLTQCLVFVPKLLAFRRFKKGRSGSQQNIMIVKTMCLGQTSSSLPSKDKTLDPDVSATHFSTSSSPSKALRKAGHSLSTVLKRCCSKDLKTCCSEHLKQRELDGEENDSYAASDGGQSPGCTGGMMSRAVSTCNLADILSQQQNPQAVLKSGMPVSELSKQCSHCFSYPDYVCNDQHGWIKTDLPSTQVTSASTLLSPADCRFEPDCNQQKCNRHHVCCYLVRPSEGRRQPTRRCMSSDALDQLLLRQSTARHGNAPADSQRDLLACNSDQVAASSDSTQAETEAWLNLSFFKDYHDKNQDEVSHHEVFHRSTIQHPGVSVQLFSASDLMLLPDSRSACDMIQINALDLPDTLKMTPLQSDTSRFKMSSAEFDPMSLTPCACLHRSVSANQLDAANDLSSSWGELKRYRSVDV